MRVMEHLPTNFVLDLAAFARAIQHSHSVSRDSAKLIRLTQVMNDCAQTTQLETGFEPGAYVSALVRYDMSGSAGPLVGDPDQTHKVAIGVGVHGKTKMAYQMAGFRACMKCHAARPRKLCTGCYSTAYCSPECSKSDWDAHKAECREGRARTR